VVRLGPGAEVGGSGGVDVDETRGGRVIREPGPPVVIAVTLPVHSRPGGRPAAGHAGPT
jgi:hypothetical protein